MLNQFVVHTFIRVAFFREGRALNKLADHHQLGQQANAGVKGAESRLFGKRLAFMLSELGSIAGNGCELFLGTGLIQRYL